MKVLVVSDSHGNGEALHQLIKKYPKMDLYLHAGDSEQDEFSIRPFISVRGNCDRYYGFNHYLLIPTPYGNMYVQHTPNVSKNVIKDNRVKIVIHGHTHFRRNEIITQVHYINPGAISYARDKYSGSYAILTIDTHSVEVEFYTLE
ncbi:MAG TPA: metallophosphoesterase family protein [Erysipelotrichaceae bacterium]|nr:metallophosphoesterase family protein [Erysipelotrichaceae bacterium]